VTGATRPLTPVYGAMIKRFWLFILLVILLAVLLAPWLAGSDPMHTMPGEQFQPPSRVHLCGTDQRGRDVWSRVLWGGQHTLASAAFSTFIALSLGFAIGGVAGIFGGWPDWLLMRGVDVALALPGLLLAMALIAVLGGGQWQTAVAVGVALTPVFSRLIRAAALGVREQLFMEAAQALGASRWRMIWQHLLPNISGQAISFSATVFAWALVNLAALDYLGLSGSLSVVTWGRMLSEGQTYLRAAPWVALAPGLLLSLSVMAVTGVSDLLRESLPGQG